MNTESHTSGAGRESSAGMQRLLGFVENGIAAQMAVDALTDDAAALRLLEAVRDRRVLNVDEAHEQAIAEYVHRNHAAHPITDDQGPGRDQHGPHYIADPADYTDATPHRTLADRARHRHEDIITAALAGVLLNARLMRHIRWLASWDRDTAQATADLITAVREAVRATVKPVMWGTDDRCGCPVTCVQVDGVDVDGTDRTDHTPGCRTQTQPSWTPLLPLPADAVEHLLATTDGLHIQALDTGDETTWHDLPDTLECEDEHQLPGDEGDEPESDPDYDACVVLVSAAFPRGVLHIPPAELVTIRVATEAVDR